MKKIQVIIGLLIAAATVIYAFSGLKEDLAFRLFFGVVVGYALVRGAFGFAGSVNRAYRNGSTKLMRSLMFLFVITSIGAGVLLFSGDITNAQLATKPINLALIIGAFLFGIGMALASCCASGVLQVLSTGALRALITLFFFGVGVFFATPLGKLDFVTKGTKVNFTDWFSTPLSKLLGGVLIVLVLALIVTYVSLYIEHRMKAKGKFTAIESETEYKNNINDELPLNPLNKKTYDIILGNPWSLKTTAVVIAAAFIALLAKFGTWGISGVFGTWFGKLLLVFGVDPNWIASYTQSPSAAGYLNVFSTNPVSFQNIGIILGGLIAGLTMARFKPSFKLSLKEVCVYALGGIFLGVAINFSQGCNAGALFSPIATFSLSGWVFLIVMTLGAVLGNFILKRVFKL